MNPVWSEFIRCGKKLLSQLAINLAYNFKSVFSNDMGQKFAGVLGSFPGLGKVTIRASSISGGKEEEATAALNSLPR